MLNLFISAALIVFCFLSEFFTRVFIVVVSALATIAVPGTAVVTAIAVAITTEAIFFRLLNINDLLLCFIKFSRYGTIVLYKAPKLVCFINLWIWSVSAFHKTSSFLTAPSQSHLICKIDFLKGRWKKESNSFLR